MFKKVDEAQSAESKVTQEGLGGMQKNAESMQRDLHAGQRDVVKLQKSVKDLQEKLKVAQAKVEEMTGDAQRARADLENYRKQVEKRIEKAEKDERDKTVIKVLPLIDDMGRAIETYPEELGALKKNFQKTLEKLELTRVVPEPGTEFDPEKYDAISVEEGEGEKEVIAETLQAGYMYEGVVLRPAMVKVKKV